MKDFYNNYRKWIVTVAVVWLALFIIFLVNTGFSLVKVNKFSNKIRSAEVNQFNIVGWDNAEFVDLYKEKLWMEQQLELAKTDSFSLGINLRDSVVQVQLKGTVLFQSKIIRQKPSNFFNGSVKEMYLNYFAEITRIAQSDSNIPKKPIKKIVAPKVGEEPGISKPDTLKNERLHWEMVTSKQMKIVINGATLNADSTLFEVPVNKDIFNYRFKNSLNDFFTEEYMPILFLWLNDADAKAIYRALPENSKCIFRN